MGQLMIFIFVLFIIFNLVDIMVSGSDKEK